MSRTNMDPLGLARYARLAVALPVDATLHVQGARPLTLGRTDVGLTEVGGTPVLIGDDPSPLAVAALAGDGAVLRVRGAVDGTAPFVFVAGELGVVDEGNEPDGMVAVQLTPRRVTIGGDDPESTLFREAPLHVYRQLPSPVTALQSGAHQLRQHLNADHAQEVRDYVSRRYGIPIDFVAAASLDHLDEHGGVVSWVGVDGGHYLRIAFSREARCPHSLALALRGELNGP